MGKAQLTVTGTRAMFTHVSAGMVANKNILTEADRAIGDGDHGVGMARGFAAVQQDLATKSFAYLNEIIDAVGVALLTSVGGAAGAIFGTFFRGGAINLSGRTEFDSSALAHLLADGLEAVQQRGGAKPGDKTMVDALEPAARRSREMLGIRLDETLTEVSEQARSGMESTKAMLPNLGKAKPLGSRALGHPDPGAVSVCLILSLMAEFANSEEENT